MRIVHIRGQIEDPIELPRELLERLESPVALFTTAQLTHRKQELKGQLEAAGHRVALLKMRHTVEAGQILGCSTRPLETDAGSLLYVGDGDFHPQALLIADERPIYRYDPLAKRWERFASEWMERIKRKRKAAMAGFLAAKRVGVIVTTKSGQQRLNAALQLRERYPQKELTILLCDEINPANLEDFTFIDAFVNTACPRIGYDDLDRFTKPLVNLDDCGIEW